MNGQSHRRSNHPRPTKGPVAQNRSGSPRPAARVPQAQRNCTRPAGQPVTLCPTRPRPRARRRRSVRRCAGTPLRYSRRRPAGRSSTWPLLSWHDDRCRACRSSFPTIFRLHFPVACEGGAPASICRTHTRPEWLQQRFRTNCSRVNGASDQAEPCPGALSRGEPVPQVFPSTGLESCRPAPLVITALDRCRHTSSSMRTDSGLALELPTLPVWLNGR